MDYRITSAQFNIKMPFYHHMDSHYEDKKVTRPSHFYNSNHYTLTRFTLTSSPRGWFNIKILSCDYRKFHCGDKILWPSYLHNGLSYILRWHLYNESGSWSFIIFVSLDHCLSVEYKSFDRNHLIMNECHNKQSCTIFTHIVINRMHLQRPSDIVRHSNCDN